MRDTIPPTPDGQQRRGFTCAHCGRTITTSIEGLFHNPARGSQQRFCDHACRQAAYRRRTAGVPETSPSQPHGGRNRSLKQEQEHD